MPLESCLFRYKIAEKYGHLQSSKAGTDLEKEKDNFELSIFINAMHSNFIVTVECTNGIRN